MPDVGVLHEGVHQYDVQEHLGLLAESDALDVVGSPLVGYFLQVRHFHAEPRLVTARLRLEATLVFDYEAYE